MSARRSVAAALGGAVAGLLVPGLAAAHTISGRVDSPLPFVAYIAGAAVAVAVSFVLVALRDPGPPADPAPLGTRVVPRVVPRVVRLGLRAIGLIAWLWIVVQAIIGGSSDADVASLFLWTYGWVGLAIVSALVGPAWTWLDPFTTLHDLGARALRRLRITGIEPQELPDWLGRWPALIGFGFFVWLELVAKVTSGRLLGIVLIGYTVVTLVGMAQYGRDTWRERCETFSAWFGTVGRLAPYALAGDADEGRVHRFGFGAGLAVGGWSVEQVVLVAMGTGSIMYDGLSQTRSFFDLFGFPAIPLGTILLILFLGGLAAVVVAVARRVGFAAVGAGLLPVALGYLVAHYFTALLVDGQRLLVAISDPFQQGWDLFGTAFLEPRSDWLPPGVVWGIQVAAVVTGHIVGAWAGHAVARVRAGGRRPAEGAGARRTSAITGTDSGHALAVNQWPLAVLMVVLTCATLWSLGQNLVFETAPPVARVTPAAARDGAADRASVAGSAGSAGASAREAGVADSAAWLLPIIHPSRRPGGPTTGSTSG